MIQTQNLSKIFFSGFLRKKIKALDRLNLEVKSNEIFGYLGPNGSGKTTSIKLFVGLLRPSTGKVKIFNQDISSQEVLSRIGYMPEAPDFYDYLTAWELLDYYGQLCHLEKSIRQQRTEELLSLVELERFKTMQLRTFSKGMLQRLGIAQALINDPKLVILDEPMAGLDPAGRKKVRDIIIDLKRKGKTVFFSTHVLWDVELICDRVGILINGRLRNIGRLDEMLQREMGFTEIIFKSLTSEGIAEIRRNFNNIVEKGNQVLVRAMDEQQVEFALSLINQKKAKIFSLTPQRKTLEDIFIKELEMV